MSAPAVSEHHELHEVLADLIQVHGSQHVGELAALARRRLGDPRITPDMVEAVAERVTTLVLLPDGRVEHLGRVLDGIVLTHRVRGPLAGRSDLWLGRGAQPFLVLACLHPLALVSGGHARISDSGAPALVGPLGWLPDVERGDLVGLRWRDGQLAVARVDEAHLAGTRSEEHVRAVLGEHINREQWLMGADPDSLAAQIVHGLTQARLEDPELLSTPHAPLEELVDDPAADHRGMSAVYADLERLAQQQGTSSEHLAAAVLAQLAASPSVTDTGGRTRPRLRVLRGGASGPPGGSEPSGPPEAG